MKLVIPRFFMNANANRTTSLYSFSAIDHRPSTIDHEAIDRRPSTVVPVISGVTY
jgi:hypothetical protein